MSATSLVGRCGSWPDDHGSPCFHARHGTALTNLKCRRVVSRTLHYAGRPAQPTKVRCPVPSAQHSASCKAGGSCVCLVPRVWSENPADGRGGSAPLQFQHMPLPESECVDVPNRDMTHAAVPRACGSSSAACPTHPSLILPLRRSLGARRPDEGRRRRRARHLANLTGWSWAIYREKCGADGGRHALLVAMCPPLLPCG